MKVYDFLRFLETVDRWWEVGGEPSRCPIRQFFNRVCDKHTRHGVATSWVAVEGLSRRGQWEVCYVLADSERAIAQRVREKWRGKRFSSAALRREIEEMLA